MTHISKRNSTEAPETMCINPKDKNGKQPSLSERVYSCNGISTAITTGWHICIIEPHQDENNG